MSKIINQSQSAFIPGRSIMDNILLSNDFVRSFHLPKGIPGMCLKLDLSKAFDSLRWDFVEAALIALRFPSMAIKWILACITSPSFSILVNGSSYGCFKSKRGIRQGCPLSPYIFCITMEFFSSFISTCSANGLIPTPYTKGSTSISHLLYADDVRLFARASIPIAGNIKAFLQNFKIFCGLSVNCAKSSVLFCNCDEVMKQGISHVLNVRV